MASKPPIQLHPDLDPWDKQPGESDMMYSRFRTFLELGPDRNLKQAAEMLTTLGSKKVSYRVLQQYSYEKRWVERAGAYDRDQDRLERARLMKQRREMMARHRKLASGLMAKAVERLAKIPVVELTALDIVRFVRTAAELEIRALGDPERTIAITGPAGGPVLTDDFSHYTPAERRSRLEQIAAELGRRAAMNDDTDDE